MISKQLLLALLLSVFLNSHSPPARAQGFPGDWTARWIWISGEAKPFHSFLMARKRLRMEKPPTRGILKISAENRYMLYVNGQYVGRGPARSDARWKSYDTYDVGPLLRPGPNVVAVLAYYYGTSNNYGRDSRSGLFAQLESEYGDGSRQILGTDSTWKVRHARAWSRDVEHVSQHQGAMGLTEVYDANADPLAWKDIDFDDSDWEQADVIRANASPWQFLEPRQTPLLDEREIFPVRVVKAGEVLELGRIAGPPKVAERLSAEPHFPVTYTNADNLDATLRADGNPASFRSSPYRPGDPLDKGVRSPFLIVDFGRPVFGFPRVRLRGPGGGIVEMTYGPHLFGERVLGLLGGLRWGDRYIMRPGQQIWQPFEYKQFRYLQIVFRNATEPIDVDAISLIEYRYPAERRGSFACSDEVMTKLWKACVDTVDLQMEDALVCDATRERRVFAADGAHGLFAMLAGYGDLPLADRYFRLLGRSATADGMIRPFYPGTEQPVGGGDLKALAVAENPMHFPQGSLVFALALGEYHDNFGHPELMAELYPRIVDLVGWFDRHRNKDGLVSDLPFFNWIDWSVNDLRGANFQTNALFAAALERLARIASGLGKSDDAVRWRDEALRVRSVLARTHWNQEKGLYVDSVSHGKQSSVVTELANGMALLFGIADEHQRARIAGSILDRNSELARVSPLFFYYVVEGLFSAGYGQEALGLLRERYGPMLAFTDAPTIWESWTPFVRVRGRQNRGELPSWVHSGGTGPAWTLTRHVLGVELQPGTTGVHIQPETAGLDWAKGVVPSMQGDVSVAWKQAGGTFSLQFETPAGLPARIVLDRPAGRSAKVIHNGETLHSGKGGYLLSPDQITLAVPAGRHELVVEPAQ